MQRGAVDFAENTNGGNAHFATGTQDANGDLTAIGNQHFSKHRELGKRANSTTRVGVPEFYVTLACRIVRGV
jgi:hypothetical protein